MQEMFKLSLYIDGRWRAGAAGKTLAPSPAGAWIDVRRRRVCSCRKGRGLDAIQTRGFRARYRTHAPYIVR
jgi:hypothetical protein